MAVFLSYLFKTSRRERSA